MLKSSQRPLRCLVDRYPRYEGRLCTCHQVMAGIRRGKRLGAQACLAKRAMTCSVLLNAWAWHLAPGVSRGACLLSSVRPAGKSHWWNAVVGIRVQRTYKIPKYQAQHLQLLICTISGSAVQLKPDTEQAPGETAKRQFFTQGKQRPICTEIISVSSGTQPQSRRKMKEATS